MIGRNDPMALLSSVLDATTTGNWKWEMGNWNGEEERVVSVLLESAQLRLFRWRTHVSGSRYGSVNMKGKSNLLVAFFFPLLNHEKSTTEKPIDLVTLWMQTGISSCLITSLFLSDPSVTGISISSLRHGDSLFPIPHSPFSISHSSF